MSSAPINNFSSSENNYSIHEFNHESLNTQNNNNNPNDKLTIIFNTVAQVMQKIKAGVQQSNNIQQLNQQINNNQHVGEVNPNGNQINNDPLQNLYNLLLNQLFQVYAPPNQNQVSNNQENPQQKNKRKNNNERASNPKRNNNNSDTLKMIMINKSLKELININKLTGLIILVSNVRQNNIMREIKKMNEEQKKIPLNYEEIISDQEKMLSKLKKLNQKSSNILEEHKDMIKDLTNLKNKE